LVAVHDQCAPTVVLPRIVIVLVGSDATSTAATLSCAPLAAGACALAIIGVNSSAIGRSREIIIGVMARC
jgi:hypothetical protein